MQRSKAWGVMAGCALALSATVTAQDKPAAEHTMTGCLASVTSDKFIVTNTTEEGPATIGIVSSKVALAGHVGHIIEITGVSVPKDKAEAASPKPPRAAHYMSLSAIKMVADTCARDEDEELKQVEDFSA